MATVAPLVSHIMQVLMTITSCMIMCDGIVQKVCYICFINVVFFINKTKLIYLIF